MLDVLMLYAIKLGPIGTGEGPTTAYVGFTEAGALPPVLASSDKDGLQELARQAQGHELRCERALLRAEYGVALYDRRGAVKKLARLIDSGRMRDAAAFGSLAVT